MAHTKKVVPEVVPETKKMETNPLKNNNIMRKGWLPGTDSNNNFSEFSLDQYSYY